ncbi:MAG: DUF2007 domain-containing protein [Nitriliruptoraceae bacterium]
MARIRRFTSRVEAEMAASMLSAHGIEAEVRNDDSGGMHPNLAYGIGGSEIVVPDDQLDEANSLLDTEADVFADEEPAAEALRRRQEADDEVARLGVPRSWIRVGALVAAAVIILLVLSSQPGFRWF